VEGSFESTNSTHAGFGADTGAPKPNNVTLAVHRKAVGSGKKQKSRVYWPSLFDSAFSGTNEISPTFGAALETALDDLRSAILAGTTSTFDYGFVSRILNHVKRTNGLFVPVLAHSLIDFVADSMRSRLPGHGL
jgi:pantothenate kinase